MNLLLCSLMCAFTIERCVAVTVLYINLAPNTSLRQEIGHPGDQCIFHNTLWNIQPFQQKVINNILKTLIHRQWTTVLR